MKVPVLMPFQMVPMNGDHLITDEMLRLKDLFKIKTAIETGTCFGSTSLWMAKNFETVLTIESNKQYLDVAIERAANEKIENIRFYYGKSESVLPDILSLYQVDEEVLILLDAHWLNACPLLDELKSIANHQVKPCIVIHDMKNPNDERFGFDSYNGQEFTFEWVKPSLDMIYGENGYTYYFNTGFKQESAQRGVLFCHPKI